MPKFYPDGRKPSFWDFYPEKVEELRKLWLKGVAATGIARALSPLGEITRCSVIGKARRLGLKTHQRSTQLKKRAKPAEAKRERLHLLPDVKHEESIVMFSGNPESIRNLPPERPATAVSLYDAKPHQCRWPVGEAKELLFCGETAVPEGRLTFCERHYARAITRQYRNVGNAAYIPYNQTR